MRRARVRRVTSHSPRDLVAQEVGVMHQVSYSSSLSTLFYRCMGTYRLGGGGGSDLLSWKKNTQCPNVQVFKLRDKTKGCTIIINHYSHLNWNSYFQTSHTVCPLWTSLLNIVNFRKLLKEEVIYSVALSENISNLVHTVNNWQTASRAIETLQDGPFGCAVEARLYK